MNHAQVAEANIIDRYLLKQLSEQELESFTDHLLACETCRKELFAAEKIVSALSRMQMDARSRSGSQAVVDSDHRPFRSQSSWIYRMAAVLALVLIGGYIMRPFFLQKENSPVASLPSQQEQIREKEAERLAAEYEKNSKTSVIPSENKTAALSRYDLRKRFNVNAELEHIMQYPTRAGSSWNVQMLSPQRDAEYASVAGKTTLAIDGTLTVSEKPAAPVMLKLYSNSPADYEKDRPQFKMTLSLSQSDPTTYRFQTRQMVILQPGLYYLTVESDAHAEPVFISRIFIDSPDEGK